MVAELRAAAEIVAKRMADCRYKAQVLRHVGIAIMRLERGEGGTAEQDTKLCRRCGKLFVFDEQHFVLRGLNPPRHCVKCRVTRRQERERARVTAIPPEDSLS